MSRAILESKEPTDPVAIFSLVEHYLPLNETQRLTTLKVLDEVIQGQQLDREVYQAIVDTVREQLDIQL